MQSWARGLIMRPPTYSKYHYQEQFLGFLKKIYTSKLTDADIIYIIGLDHKGQYFHLLQRNVPYLF